MLECCTSIVQGRGGRGVTGARMRDNDTVEEVVHVMDHDTVLFFSPDGICRSLKAYQIPVSSKIAMGAPLTQVQDPPHYFPLDSETATMPCKWLPVSGSLSGLGQASGTEKEGNPAQW